MGQILLGVRQTPSSLSPSANSVGIGRNTFDISLIQAIVLRVSVKALLSVQKSFQQSLFDPPHQPLQAPEARMMTYKQLILATKNDWKGIVVQDSDPQGNHYDEPC